MGIIEAISEFIEDLLGCEEGDTACEAKARKYATWTVLGVILLVAILVVPRVYKLVKSK